MHPLDYSLIKSYYFPKAFPLGQELMFAKHDKHYPNRSRQTSLATVATNFSKPAANINSGLSK